MRVRFWIALLPALCLVSNRANADEGFALDAKRRVLKPISYKNLTLLPVVKTKAEKAKEFEVLDQGMKKGVVKIHETDSGGSVNTLIVANNSDDPLFLMAGEVIIGGKQDRIIGKDAIVPPKSKESVPVYCVEHGRWSGRKASFETTKALAHTKLRMKAKYADQGKVWGEVSAKNSMRGTENATDTYRQIAKGKGVSTSIAGYEKHFAKALAKDPANKEMVGFVVVLDGKVMAIETFHDAKLFHKLKDKLLRSYYVEAVDHPVSKQPPSLPEPKAVKSFARKAKAAKRKVVRAAKGGRTFQFDADGVVGSAVSDAPAAAAPAEQAGDAVYESAYAEE